MKPIKILYVLQFNTSLGDSLTNMTAHLGIIKEKHPNSVIYVICNTTTYITGVTNIFLNTGLIDFVFPINWNSQTSINGDANLYKDYIKYLKNNVYDITVHTMFLSDQMRKFIYEISPTGIHIEIMNDAIDPHTKKPYGLQTIYDYCGIQTYTEHKEILQRTYDKNYVDEFIQTVVSHAGNKKIACIFFGSSRALAQIGSTGLKNISNITSKAGYTNYLIGTTTHNIYDINMEGDVSWHELYTKEYDNCINLIGNNWIKTLALLKKSDIIISGPTGAAMIPPLINKNQIMITGGDTPVLSSCLSAYTNKNYSFELECTCVNYPCQSINKPGFKDIDKYNTCLSNKHALCLNDELNIQGLSELLNQLN